MFDEEKACADIRHIMVRRYLKKKWKFFEKHKANPLFFEKVFSKFLKILCRNFGFGVPFVCTYCENFGRLLRIYIVSLTYLSFRAKDWKLKDLCLFKKFKIYTKKPANLHICMSLSWTEKLAWPLGSFFLIFLCDPKLPQKCTVSNIFLPLRLRGIWIFLGGYMMDNQLLTNF